MAQKPDSLLYKQLADYPFVFVSDSIVTSPPVITDSLFDMIARGIRFQVNRTELQKGDPFITLYNDSLVPWLKENNLILREIFVKGAASPEGPYDNNVRLSRERTKRLIEFLSSNLDQPIADRPTNSKFVTEDYAYLVKLMELAGDAEYRKVKAIWDACKGNERLCKKKLMALNGGKTWKRLLKVYFPTLRQSRVVLWFVVSPKHMPIPKYHFTAKTEMLAIPTLPSFLPVPTTPDTTADKAYARRHMIAARTNLIHDFLYVPQFGFAPGGNIQLEYYPLSGHYTFNAGFTFHNHRHWNSHKFFQVRDAQLEVRRYFKGGGEFLGAIGHQFVDTLRLSLGKPDACRDARIEEPRIAPLRIETGQLDGFRFRLRGGVGVGERFVEVDDHLRSCCGVLDGVRNLPCAADADLFERGVLFFVRRRDRRIRRGLGPSGGVGGRLGGLRRRDQPRGSRAEEA